MVGRQQLESTGDFRISMCMTTKFLGSDAVRSLLQQIPCQYNGDHIMYK